MDWHVTLRIGLVAIILYYCIRESIKSRNGKYCEDCQHFIPGACSIEIQGQSKVCKDYESCDNLK
jgi:hypothetical protein